MYESYNPSLRSLLRFPFPGSENIAGNYSQAYQDLFVLGVLGGKRDGTFLEVGSFDPVTLSNTLLLEKDFDWNGASVDHSEDAINKMKAYPRKCFASLNDAVEINYDALLDSLGIGMRIDYLSIDVEPNVNTLKAMKRLLLMSRRFSVITFETDVYAGTAGGEDPTVREQARELMPTFGYVLVAGNISAFGDDEHPFEDWYLDTEVFSPEMVAKIMRPSDEPIAAHKYIFDLSKEGQP